MVHHVLKGAPTNHQLHQPFLPTFLIHAFSFLSKHHVLFNKITQHPMANLISRQPKQTGDLHLRDHLENIPLQHFIPSIPLIKDVQSKTSDLR